ncbi:HAD family hydrolase [Gordonia neofelifaecis]|uniref:HAD family hydrolase n=1 Tax=Gordonia neofelifaecis TaxID=945692 RepID=UPI000590AAEA|nr:beta-phosphoglucomutase family hydrolase [Gordonia neofelifaecis]
MLGLPDDITVALFDLDGVLTDTASVHRIAWTAAFDDFLTERAGGDIGGRTDELRPFTDQDYFDYVDGRPRMDGVRTFLASRGLTVDEATASAVADGKNTAFLASLERDGVTAYPGSVRYLHAARDAGLHIAVVTSSRNGEQVLEAAGLSEFVERRVDGNTIVAEQLAGKPAPDSYLRGAELMGVAPAAAAVFEDAISGVEAGVAGRFGYVVGIDRVGGGQSDAMTTAGASIVVTDLDELLAGD